MRLSIRWFCRKKSKSERSVLYNTGILYRVYTFADKPCLAEIWLLRSGWNGSCVLIYRAASLGSRPPPGIRTIRSLFSFELNKNYWYNFLGLYSNKNGQGWKLPYSFLRLNALKCLKYEKTEKLSSPNFGCLNFNNSIFSCWK